MKEMTTILIELLMLMAGFGLCLLAALWLRHHDAEKDHRIFFLEWHNARLSAQLDLLQGQQPERPELPLEEPKPKEERKRRSSAKADKQEAGAPLPPPISAQKPVSVEVHQFKKCANGVPSIPQSELGRMQANLNRSGAAKIVFDGGKNAWTPQ